MKTATTAAKATETKTTAPVPVAISYLRFSDPKQSKGDSVRRQTEDVDRWCKKEGVVLDDSFRLSDRGKSAFTKGRRKAAADDGMARLPELDELVNPDRRALKGFLDLIGERRIPRGSFLIIENLDRLSRDDLVPAMNLLSSILMSGVKVVVLSPRELVLTAGAEMSDVLLAVVELARGNSESRGKSARTRAFRELALRLARKKANMPPRRKDGKVTRAITSRLPAWVEEKNGRLCLVRRRAAVVRRIFEMAKAGLGMTSIVKKLTAEGVPAFGDRERDPEENGYRGKKGVPFGCGEWRTSYVRSILKDRRALGEYQPRDLAKKKVGAPIRGYYPRVVSAEEFNAARVEIGERENPKRENDPKKRNPQGRLGNGVPNLFGGLLRNARDGETYYAAMRSENGDVFRYLLNKSSREGRSKCYTFSLAVFERAILSELRELKPADVLAPKKGAAAVAALEGELDYVRKKKAALAAELLKGDVAAIGEALRGLETREAELAAKVEAAAVEKARPMEETWRDAKTLTDLLATAPEDELADLRERLRAALRRIVDSIWLLVVPRGKDRLCAVRVYFPSGAYRAYLIVFRSGAGNQKAKRPGRYAVLSVRHEDDGIWRYWKTGERPTWNPKRARVVAGVEDLRDAVGAEMVLKSLEDYPAWAIESDLKDGEDAPRS